MILLECTKTGRYARCRDMAHAYRTAQVRGFTDYTIGPDDGEPAPAPVVPKRGRIMAGMKQRVDVGA